jgi:hypothetical protein
MAIFKGYHGTSLSAARSIITSQTFNLTIDPLEWLGDGIYFFVEGYAANILSNAKKWAIAEAWDNRLKRLTYFDWAVIEVDINVPDDELLDLNKYIDQSHFNDVRRAINNDIVKRKIASTPGKTNDGYCLNYARNQGIIPFNVVKGDFYIKFAEERRYNINYRIPNCTICAVLKDSYLSNIQLKVKGKVR